MALSAVGCKPAIRLRGADSFRASQTPLPPNAGPYGDDFSYGGLANSSGGLRARTRYSAGATDQGRPLPAYDVPAKGTGLQPGEVPPPNAPWWAQQNAPIWQTPAGSENGKGTRIPQ